MTKISRKTRPLPTAPAPVWEEADYQVPPPAPTAPAPVDPWAS